MQSNKEEEVRENRLFTLITLNSNSQFQTSPINC